ncbi:hypothetical protein Ait01nite_043880 [Actinoplanes italicus]|uniref:Uncharacterized protein DUF1775 n=1 Tax=Actinoplanes italicus TaxID=113567 RepID=A0A2T0KC91_9ACTN|nr:DUF1775 domain-containing protein [Actinoplanes italicus]PRX20869.1 uncharacterized protein DUF1775 [Actinoplanes italicus]GIE31343.1 hypothetical protein Ait01nite_043880 [Actinoplanes italicus]
MARRAGVMTAVTAVGVLFAAGPAAADVTVNPASVPQGSGANLSFHVTNEGTAPITEVTLKIPADTPIAEVYPLSVDDWAPRITYRKLSVPLDTIHGGTPVTEASDSIVWLAVNGAKIEPGKSADLTVALGPMPALSSVRFMMDTKYADGTAGPTMPATVATSPSNGGLPVSHHGGTAGNEGSASEQALFDQIAAQAQQDDGPSPLSIGGWVVAALALLAVGFMALRGRHRAEEEPGEPEETPAGDDVAVDEDGEKEPVAAGDSKWSYKG